MAGENPKCLINDRDQEGMYYYHYAPHNKYAFDDVYFRNRGHMPYAEQTTNRIPVNQNPEDFAVKKYIGSGVAFVGLVAENILCHPFQVLRRQCQVHHTSQKYHLLPITLIPTVYHLHQHQGLTTLWKGLGSVLLVRGLSLGVEDLISKITPWPKDINSRSSVKQFFQHTLLKCVSLAIVTPFYSASFVETVQSEIASERPGILDVFREGFIRLLSWSGGSKGRMIPIWALILPTVTLGLAKYLFSLLVKGASAKVLQARCKYMHQLTGATPKDLANSVELQNINFTASLIATISTDAVFYPCETIVHRLHLQGTRTIVDNLDNGKSVLPILTNYTGAIDCYESCLAAESVFGLYKGFGALLVQYAMHVTLLNMTRFFFTEIGALLSKPKPILPVQPDTSPPTLANLNMSNKSYLLP